MKAILVSVPDEMKAALDLKRQQGYSLNGFVRQAITRALVESLPPVRTGRIGLQYRKPGRKWQRRTVPARQLEQAILKLEESGAEIRVSTPR